MIRNARFLAGQTTKIHINPLTLTYACIALAKSLSPMGERARVRGSFASCRLDCDISVHQEIFLSGNKLEYPGISWNTLDALPESPEIRWNRLEYAGCCMVSTLERAGWTTVNSDDPCLCGTGSRNSAFCTLPSAFARLGVMRKSKSDYAANVKQLSLTI